MGSAIAKKRVRRSKKESDLGMGKTNPWKAKKVNDSHRKEIGLKSIAPFPSSPKSILGTKLQKKIEKER